MDYLKNRNKAIFLDRDGTLNEDSIDYIKSASEFHLFDFTAKALSILKRLGYKIILITNQSAVGRKMITVEELDKIHEKLQTELRRSDSEIHGIYYCPHLPEEDCGCRKPKTGNLRQALQDFNIDAKQSFFIGDSFKDIQTGTSGGCRTIFVRTGVNSPTLKTIKTWQPQPDYIVKNLLEAAQLIECIERSQNL